MVIIQLKNISKSFGENKALKNIDLEIEKGTILGFLGPNGAGKTTTIGIILGLLRADMGSVLINKENPWNNVKAIQDVGYIPADTYFYDDWTGQDYFNLLIKLGFSKDLIKSYCKMFEFNPKAKINTLSTGNKQKLSIILALAKNPQILIMDEPTRGLDPILQNKFYEEIQKLNKTGVTVLVSSHNLSEIENICKEVCLIRKGEIIEHTKVANLDAKKLYIIKVVTDQVDFLYKDLNRKYTCEKANGINNEITIKTDTEINSFLKDLAKYKIDDLSINKASLEDIFLQYYKD